MWGINVMKAFDYISHMVEVIPEDALIVASHTDNSTSLITLNQSYRSLLGFNMGFSTPVGLGVASALPNRRVIILDGDGGVLLLSQAITDLANESPSNAIVVVADNGSALEFPVHSNRKANIEEMAKAVGIENTCTVSTIEEFKDQFGKALKRGALTYIVAKIESGVRVPIPAGTYQPFLHENKFAFVRHIEKTEKISIMRPFGGRM
jgi:thiamine pyrophosphate-dependent acetolactate synthase large subunit-like protein